jgi:Leucine-rich repeat (LRR) protein
MLESVSREPAIAPGNGETCLTADLACLTNLRQLTMDGNQIKSLEGVLQLKRLTHLRARGNKVSVLDLTGATL